MSDTGMPEACPISIAIAGITVSIMCREAAIAQALANRYGDFLTSEPPSFELEVEIQSAPARQAFATPQVYFLGERVSLQAPDVQGSIDPEAGKGSLILSSPNPTDVIDYCLRVVYAILALRDGGFLFHGAGIVRGEKAYVFFGHSGSGKTTVARLSPADRVLNDDLVVLMPEASGWMVHATPFWSSKQVRPEASRAPLAGLFRLVQDKQVYLEPVSGAAALAEMVANVPVIPANVQKNAMLLALANAVLESISLYYLHFLPDASFWELIV